MNLYNPRADAFNRRTMVVPGRCLLICWCICLYGCESPGYYSQALSGQLSLYGGRQSIESLVEKPDTAEDLRTQLELVLELRAFAQSELQLPVKNQYSDYIDLKRDFVVWNVFVAPELSLQAKTWCYPIVGCASYRGYFSESGARTYAEGMSAQGFDTHVGGVAAYSTLGWLNDPVLNTFVFRREPKLAELIFHELAHQLLYVPGDTAFNESFATTVAREGVRRWLLRQGDAQRYGAYQQTVQEQEDFVRLLSRYRDLLESVYASGSSDTGKRHRKAELITRLRQDYGSLERDSGGELPYAGWMAGPINNAKLNSVALYHDLVPGLENMLAEEGHQMSAFYSRCRELADLSPEMRLSSLEVRQ